MLNDRLRDTTRSRLSSTHNEGPVSPRVQCDGCSQLKVVETRLGNVEALQRSDSLDLAELTGSVMASIEGLRRETQAQSTALGDIRDDIKELVAAIGELKGKPSSSDSFPVKANMVDAKMGDKYRLRSSAWTAIVITLIVVSGWVTKDWISSAPRQQTTQSGK